MGGLLGSLLPALGGMLAGGGLQQVLSGFQANGLSAQTDSWIGTGENKPISGEDVRKVVGAEELAKIAAQLGVSEDEAADAVAQVLPTVVDKVSPEGHLAPDERARLGVRRARAARRRDRHGPVVSDGDVRRERRRIPSRRSSRSRPYSRNSPRATVTAWPPTSTRSISPPLPSARA